MVELTNLIGRDLLLSELLTEYNETDLAGCTFRPAFQSAGRRAKCGRCGSFTKLADTYPCICGSSCFYCRHCIQLGKVRACDKLVSLKAAELFTDYSTPYLKWSGVLSAQQEKASKEIDLSIREYTDRVVWAVTGAGKTEMLFRGISEAMEAGKRVCVASPRIDVCLELAPRIQAVFPDIQIALLYGGEGGVYAYTQLVIATTHQLLRFREAFDVLIIDEIDAFPYYQNEGLYYASEKAVKIQSSTIYLTATPDRKLQRKIANGQIKASILPARYHGYPLPVPTIIREKDIFSKKELSASKAYKQIMTLISQGQNFLLFIPTIRLMDSILPAFRKLFSSVRFESVHAQDPLRKEKVEAMRNGELEFLITTTILERGVTFKNIDVIVLAADHDVYTEAALVQIAGRAGRSAAYPEGKVTFYLQEWTRSSKGAVRQIRQMNKRAAKKGLLL